MFSVFFHGKANANRLACNLETGKMEESGMDGKQVRVTYVCTNVHLVRIAHEMEYAGQPWFATFVSAEGDVIDCQGYLSPGSPPPQEGSRLVLEHTRLDIEEIWRKK